MSDVLIVEDDNVLREALTETMTLAGHPCVSVKNGQEALRLLATQTPSLILSDMRMDRVDGLSLLEAVQKKHAGIPVILMTAYGSIDDAVQAMRLGAVDYLQKPFSAQSLTDMVGRYIKPQLNEDEHQPIAQDPKSQALMSMALRVADSDVGVMITGESGTGKEVLAHFIHDHSPRRAKPFVAINCAAIPEQMLEATLFGYEKGAFTGAYKSTPGKFEQAQGGTLLLDEVSEMSLPLQAKLLRVLQEKEVERIGSNQLIHLDVRVLATSNRKLEEEVACGKFREDLYYRLNVFPLHWLPLRERQSDILPLASYLLYRHCQKSHPVVPQFSKASENALLSYPWPGNARELDNVVQRALVLHTQGFIEPEHLQLPGSEPKKGKPVSGEKRYDLEQNEFDFIAQVIEKENKNRQEMASILGVSERTLRYKLAKMREKGYAV